MLYHLAFNSRVVKKADGEKDEVALEALIETERASLGASVTKVTLESFLAWKKRKIQEKKEKISELEEKKKRDFKLGFMNGLSGRDIFTFNPDLIANDDDEAQNDIDYRVRDDDEDEEGSEAIGEVVAPKVVREINADYLAQLAQDVDGSGTVATSDRFDYIKTAVKPKVDDSKKHDMACGGGVLEDIEDGEEEEEEEDVKNEATKAKNKNIEIDESLFTLEDLDNIEDELEDLDI